MSAGRYGRAGPFPALAWALLAGAVLLLLPLPGELLRRWPALEDELQDFAHFVLFAGLAHLCFQYLRRRAPRPSRAPWLQVLLAMAAYAAVTELAQLLVARSASVMDFMRDLLGATFALLLHARREAATRTSRSGFSALAAAVAVMAIVPLAWVATAYIHRWIRAPLLWADDSALFMRLAHWQAGRYPGLVLEEPLPDWSKWQAVDVALSNPGPGAVTITVRVHDRRHDRSFDDRYNGRFLIPANSSQTLHIPLEQIAATPGGRWLELEHIAGMMVFATANQDAPRIDVHSIRLVR